MCFLKKNGLSVRLKTSPKPSKDESIPLIQMVAPKQRKHLYSFTSLYSAGVAFCKGRPWNHPTPEGRGGYTVLLLVKFVPIRKGFLLPPRIRAHPCNPC